MTGQQQRFARLLFIYALLVITPVFFSLLLWLHMIDHASTLWQKQAAEIADNQASALIKQLDPELIFQPHFRSLTNAIFALPSLEPTQIRELAEKTFTQISQRFYVYVFDAQGNLLKTGLAPENNETGMDFVWRYATNREKAGEHREFRGEYGKLIGRYFNLRNIREKNDVCHVGENYRGAGLIYHKRRQSNSNDNSGVICYLDLTIDFERHLQPRICQISTSDTPAFFTRADGSWPIDNGIGSATREISQLAFSNTRNTIVHKDFLWRRTSFRNFNLYFGKHLALARYRGLKKQACLFALLLLLLSFIFLVRNLQASHGMRISIRYKLIAIFVFAVYLPLLGLFLVSYKGLEDHRTVLENEAHKGMQDILYKIDADFANKEKEILDIFQRLYHDRTWQDQIGEDHLQNEMLLRSKAGVPLDGDNFFNHLDMRNIKLEQVYSSARGVANERIKEVNRIISLICLERFMPEQIAKHRSKLRQSDFILKNMMENPVLGFSSLFEQPGRIVEMDFEGSSFYWYWNYYPDAGNSIAYFSANTRVHHNVENFLNAALGKRYSIGNVALTLAAHFPGQQTWIPEEAGKENELNNLMTLSDVSKTLKTGRIIYDRQKYLAACLPGIKLKGTIVSCLYPQSEIDYRISSQRIKIYQGMALILIISIFTGLLLSKHFLRPVSELNLGLKALRQRDTGFRVNIDSQDEFGELGHTFNQMMEEVKEMLLAGAVQQCLIPSHFPEIEGYDCIIYNKMATDVGGDYADVFTLGNERYLVVLGDVTGHGVSSSILTAMVKALIFRFVKKERSLDEILRNLSEMIFELMRYRKLMTFCALIFDAREHTCQFANAGHPFPVWCDREGHSKPLDQEALPLGVSPKRSHYQVVEGQFDEGDLMLLYTDGIAEGTSPDGCAFGFDHLRELIIENRSLSSEQIKDLLLEQFWQHYQREELDDDLTFVIIRRCRQGA